MTFAELLKELQGDRSQDEFAKEVGLGQPTISMLLSGQRQPGITVIRKLCKAYPGQQDRIMDIFFAPNLHYQDEPITNVKGATA